MTQKLAIAISGAVSLGSYESGVMYEIIEAIAQHNEHPDTTDDEKVEIDVITGASAGAMTACILAQKLLFSADELRDSKTNPLFSAWVRDADIKGLLNFREDEDPNKSILSSALIAEIGRKYLIDRYKTPRIQKKHSAAAAEIYLGIAMSNLNGFDYEIPLTNLSKAKSPEDLNRSFIYTQHKDRSVHILDSNSDKEEVWKEIELRGRSSGAFPFAFRVLPVIRKKGGEDKEEVFNGSRFEKGKDPENQTFVYTDGGVFENEPLGMAKRLVNQVDKEKHRAYENRFFLFVAPGAKKSTGITFTAEDGTYLNTAKALASSIFSQARFQDWITTSEINEAIKRFDRQAIALKDLLQTSPDKEAAFNIVADSLLNALYQSTNPEEESLANAIKRLEEQFKEEFEDLTKAQGEKVAKTWIKTVLTLEKSADLGSRDLMRVYAITSNDIELGGEQLSAFGGFFGQNIREHDYNLGRLKATNFLNSLQALNLDGKVKDQIFLKRFTAGKEIGQVDPKLGKLEFSDLPVDLREQVRDRILDRMKRIIDSLEIQWSFGKFLLQAGGGLFFRKQLNKLLKIKY
jgi:Patatin-like phospholipase